MVIVLVVLVVLLSLDIIRYYYLLLLLVVVVVIVVVVAVVRQNPAPSAVNFVLKTSLVVWIAVYFLKSTCRGILISHYKDSCLPTSVMVECNKSFNCSNKQSLTFSKGPLLRFTFPRSHLPVFLNTFVFYWVPDRSLEFLSGFSCVMLFQLGERFV